MCSVDIISDYARPPLMKGDYEHGALSMELERGYIRQDDQCGLCGQTFRPLERCFALLGNEDDGTKYAGNTRPFPYINRDEGNEFIFGGLSGWKLCQPSYEIDPHKKFVRESALLHTECFELFRSECKHSYALDRLFRSTVWRKPWPRMPNLALPEARDVISLPVMERMSAAYGLSDLSALPIEILFLIWNNCPDAPMWRYHLVLSIAEQLNGPMQGPREDVLLGDVLSWTRGDRPVLCPGTGTESNILITLDSRGIRSVERLSKQSRCQYRRSRNRRYVMIQDSPLIDEAICMDGLMRLGRYSSHPGPIIIDTPDVHDLPIPSSLGPRTRDGLTEQFGTIDLSTVTGLTMFLEQGQSLVSMHGHTKLQPFAEAPRELMSDSMLGRLMWTYIPIPPGEKILSMHRVYSRLGWYDHDQDRDMANPHYQIETRLAGLLDIGKGYESSNHPFGSVSMFEEKHKLLEDARILVFIKQKSESKFQNLPDAPGIAGYPSLPRASKPSDSGGLPVSPPLTSDLINATVFTEAPMEDVVAATVFTIPGGDVCRGVLFEYKNDAQRSVGQCRLGHDDAVTVNFPVFIEFPPVREETSSRANDGRSNRQRNRYGRAVRFLGNRTVVTAGSRLQPMGQMWLSFRDQPFSRSPDIHISAFAPETTSDSDSDPDD